ncbi:MAG: DJ-1/PfpI family protein [Saonia sp.]
MKKIIYVACATILVLSCQQPKTTPPNTDNPLTIAEKKVRNLKSDGSPYSEKELDALSHDKLMAIMYEAPRDTIKTIGILLYDGYFSLDAMGPHSVLSSMYPAKTFFIAREKGIVTSNNGLKTQVDTTMADVTELDILLVPGGTSETYRATKDRELLNWVKAMDQRTKYTTSVCTGSWILGAAGLLKGKNATTNWYRAKEKMNAYGAHFVKERYTNDGKYWTSAGVSAGIDMSLALVDHIMGRNYADFVMLNLEYDPDPPFDGGAPEKADPVVLFMTQKMYDLSIDPIIDAMEKAQK